MLEIKVTVSAKQDYIPFLDDVLLKALQSFGVVKARAFHFALHEVIINSIEACKKREVDGDVTIHLWTDDKRINATITDEFGGILEGKKELFIIKAKEKESLVNGFGRGMLLIEHLVDEYEWINKGDDVFEVFIASDLEK